MRFIRAVLAMVAVLSALPKGELAAQADTVLVAEFRDAPLAGAQNATTFLNNFRTRIDSVVMKWTEEGGPPILIRGYADGVGCEPSLQLKSAECDALNQSWALQRANLLRDELLQRSVPGNGNVITIEGVVVTVRGPTHRKVQVFFLSIPKTTTIIRETSQDLSGLAKRSSVDSIKIELSDLESRVNRLDSLSRLPKSFLGFEAADFGLAGNFVYQTGINQRTDVLTPTASLYLHHHSGITLHFWGGRVPWSRRLVLKGSPTMVSDTVPRADYAFGGGIIWPFGRHIAATFGFERFGEIATGSSADFLDRSIQYGQGLYAGLDFKIEITKGIAVFIEPTVIYGLNRIAFDPAGANRWGAGLNFGLRTNSR